MIRWLLDVLANRKYNNDLKKMGIVDESEIVETSVGWRPDRRFEEDKSKETASGNKEYSRVIRRGKRRD